MGTLEHSNRRRLGVLAIAALLVAALIATLAPAGGGAPVLAAPGKHKSKGTKKKAKRCSKAKKKRGKRAGAKNKPGKGKRKTKKKCKKKAASDTRPVLFVGNNWDGTADVLRVPTKQKPKADYARIARLNIVPDIEERMAEIQSDPVDLGYFIAIQQLVGEGHNQYVDDMYSTKDGELLVVSRPSFADVVGIRIATGKIVWRFRVAGQRSDHMGVSPDGNHVAVSASTGNVVHILDMQTGREVGTFESGDSPHENTYSSDGSKIFHASIGLVYTPADQPVLDTTKGERYFQVVDAKTNQIISRVDMGQKLAEAGYPGMSSAVRPMALSPDERTVYLQVSFFHGFVEYDLVNQRVTRVANLPNLVPDMPREQYLLDSAHHGIAMNGAGTKICAAGTMSDYAAIVNRGDFSYKLIKGGEKPYWSTNSNDGKRCYVSWSGSDRISVIDYETEKEIARVNVGDHPQRMRMGRVRIAWLKTLP